jgi:hypothetical protein
MVETGLSTIFQLYRYHILEFQVCIMLAMNDTYAHVYGGGSDVQRHFQQYFSYIVVVSFIRKPEKTTYLP